MSARSEREALVTVALTAATLVCFAANSLLCRMALASRSIDAASVTSIRLWSGAAVISAVVLMRRSGSLRAGSWRSAITLFLYAVPFSLAYLRIAAGVGALILFGVVQATMIGWGIARGERPRLLVWLGLVVAVAGLCFLTVPGATAPDPLGAGLMALAGVGWGVFSLLGRASKGDPIAANAGTFLRCAPLALALVGIAAWHGPLQASPRGIALAVASGGLASGGGYSLWYSALRRLSATTAAVVQLLVPVLASLGGLALLGEQPSPRIVLAGVAILGGVALAIRGRG
jgi:drug/metabolite transporter (DMT)-like permease